MFIRPEQELPADFDPRTRPWYEEAIANPNSYIVTEPYTDAGSGKTVISVAKAISSNGEYVGAIGIGFEINKVVEEIFGDTGDTQKYLINGSGKVLLASKNASIKADTDLNTENLFKQVQEASSKEDCSSFHTKATTVTRWQCNCPMVGIFFP